jgi:hypothetical protein
MSVDVLQTKAGINSSEGFNASSMMITVVVEADVIEYGLPPENYEPIVQSAKLLPTDITSTIDQIKEENKANKVGKGFILVGMLVLIVIAIF